MSRTSEVAHQPTFALFIHPSFTLIDIALHSTLQRISYTLAARRLHVPTVRNATPRNKRARNRKYDCLYYDHHAGNLVATLLAAANLDPSTTVEQMDGMDLRFYCPGWANQPGRMAMGWRDAVRTYGLVRWFSQIEAANQLRSGPWEVFSAEETALIKEKEMANIEDERFRFRCNTCANAVWIRHRELENHLQGWHSIVAHPNPTAEFHLHPRRPPQPLTFNRSENIGP
ncbi:hypothetical protein FRC00_009964 [Tulasnella sp. 408]|nr:hypothetical protein FRC00_009964 [Tulasnella sp. 408]